MDNNQLDIKQLHRDMEYILNDTEHFLKDLRGRKHLKRTVKKDALNLKAHLLLMTDHLNQQVEYSE